MSCPASRWSTFTGLLPAPAPGTPAAGRFLTGRPAVVASLGDRRSADVTAALRQAGAEPDTVTDLTGARRLLTLLGHHAAVIVDAPAITAPLLDALPWLARQDAVLVRLSVATSAERILLLSRGADHVLGLDDAAEVPAVLAATVRRTGLRQQELPADTVHGGGVWMHLTQRQVTLDGRPLRLTALEFDLLAYFLAHPGEPLSRERLLADVWGYDLGGLETVTVHVRRLRTKIETDPSRPTRLLTVWGVGYRLDSADHSTVAPEPAAAALV